MFKNDSVKELNEVDLVNIDNLYEANLNTHKS